MSLVRTSASGRSWLWALLGSATFHVLLLVGMLIAASGWLAQRERAARRDSAVSPTGAASSSAPTDPPAPEQGTQANLTDADPQAMAGWLAAQAAEADAMDTSERLRRLEAQTQWLAERSADSVARVADKVTSLVGAAPSRAMAPREELRDAPGSEFVADTATLYDMVRRTEADGRTVYDWVLVDAQGRSLVVTYEASAMTPQDLAAARVFDLARQNPNLRTLVDAARSILVTRPQAGSAREAMQAP